MLRWYHVLTFWVLVSVLIVVGYFVYDLIASSHHLSITPTTGVSATTTSVTVDTDTTAVITEVSVPDTLVSRKTLLSGLASATSMLVFPTLASVGLDGTLPIGRTVGSAELGGTYTKVWVGLPLNRTTLSSTIAYSSLQAPTNVKNNNVPRNSVVQISSNPSSMAWFLVTTDYTATRRYTTFSVEKDDNEVSITQPLDLLGASYTEIGGFLVGRNTASYIYAGCHHLEGLWLEGTALKIAVYMSSSTTLAQQAAGDTSNAVEVFIVS